MSGEPGQPRPPRDMQGLLRFSVEAGSSQGTSQITEPMSSERKEWLNAVLRDITVDHVAAMKGHLAVIQAPQHSCEEKAEALDELTSLCENIDFAKDFHKIGGYPVLTTKLSHSNPGIRSRVCELVATLVQNNTYCQQQALDAGWLALLVTTLDDDASAPVKVKALYAISCLSRNNAAAQQQFCELDGFSVLIRAMQSDVDKLRVKAAFLLTSLVTDQPRLADTLCDIGMVDQLVANLREDHSATHEHFMSALRVLVCSHQRALSEARRPDLNLRHLLHERIAQVEGCEEYLEEKQHAQDILDVCFAERETTQDR